VEKTTEQGTLPSFSLGLTQMEEEDEKNINDSSSAGDTNKDHRKREAKGKKKKHKPREPKEHKKREAKGKEKKEHITRSNKRKQESEEQMEDEQNNEEQLEDEQERLRAKKKVTGSSSGGDKHKEQKEDARSKEKRHKKRKQQNDGEDSDEGSLNEENAKHRLRHKLSIPKVYEIMNSIYRKRNKTEIIEVLNKSGFGGMLHICNWKRIHTFFVDWVVKNFDKDNMWIVLSKNEVLPLKEEDVHRVYELPVAGKKINVDLCSEEAIKKLRKELGLTGTYSASVRVTELERILKTLEKPNAWVKGAICYIIHNILCPTNSSFVSLQYAHIFEDPAGVSSYNWCSHVLEYMKEGLQNPEVANPLADFHFLMVIILYILYICIF
jgi:hypothetical protein